MRKLMKVKRAREREAKKITQDVLRKAMAKEPAP
jgi:hypothetical protein